MSVMSLDEMVAVEENKARRFKAMCEDRQDFERLQLAVSAEALLADIKRRGEHLSKVWVCVCVCTIVHLKNKLLHVGKFGVRRHSV